MKIAPVFYSKELGGFIAGIKDMLKSKFEGCSKIAIKLHFGEPGNETSLRPEYIKPLTDVLVGLGIGYFFFDSSTAYGGARGNPDTHKKMAMEKGWGELGEIRLNDDFIVVKGENMEYEVCKELADADGVLVVSHFKGHICAGFGGGVKNLGMGALTKKTKSEIHGGAKPELIGKCTKCEACVRSCPLDGIRLDENGPVFEMCYGCSNCVYSCTADVLKTKLNYFDVLLGEGAAVAASQFKKAFYLNYMINITKRCDCLKDSGAIIAENAGYLASEDGVAIDKAAYDIIVKQAGEDVFLKNNKKTGLQHLEAAEKFGMGQIEYKLKKI